MTTPTYPRIGVIGAGGLAGKQIYPNLAVAGLQLAAVCDLDRAKAEARTAQYGGRAFDSVDAMLSAGSLDGVIVCIGPEQHTELAIRVLDAGLPVYTEKPPAVNAAECWRMVEASRRSGKLCMTAMKKRYADVYRRAKALIDSPDFGTPRQLSHFRAGGFWKNLNSRTDILLDYAVHNIDLSVWLFGDVAEVFAVDRDRQAVSATFVYRNGATGTFALAGDRGGYMPDENLEITGSGGTHMSIHHQAEYRIVVKGQVAEVRTPNFSLAGGDGGAVTGHRVELEAFAKALTTGEQPTSHIASSYRSMEVLDAIERSLRSRKVEAVTYREEIPIGARARG